MKGQVNISILLLAIVGGLTRAKTGLDTTLNNNLLDTVHTGCPNEFEGMCHCGIVPYGPNRVATYVTNCTNPEFEDSGMLTHLPIETEVLIFVGNDIYDLHFNIFGREPSLGKLHTVDLSNNHIQTIKGRTFHNVNSVRKLILNDNDLYMIGKDFHPRMFSNFVSLEDLELRNAFSDKDVKDKNEKYLINIAETFRDSTLVNLKSLDLSENGFSDFKNVSFFQSLPSLEKLNLRNNKMSNFEVNLSFLHHLKQLDLSNNYFPYLRQGTLNALRNITGLKLNLSGNPLNCTCRMKDTYLYLLKNMDNIVDKENTRCLDGFPRTNVGKRLFDIDPRDLQCQLTSPSDFSGHLHVSYVVLGLICVVAFVLLTVILIRNRREVQSLALRVSEPVRNKFNYSSLDKKDVEAEMEV